MEAKGLLAAVNKSFLLYSESWNGFVQRLYMENPGKLCLERLIAMAKNWGSENWGEAWKKVKYFKNFLWLKYFEQ